MIDETDNDAESFAGPNMKVFRSPGDGEMGKQMAEIEYIHTFNNDEQDRLVRQAELLEPHLHRYIDLSDCSRLQDQPGSAS